MNRDDLPTRTDVTLSTRHALAIGRNAYRAIPPEIRDGGDLHATVNAMMRTPEMAALWQDITPESARDALATMARDAVKAGVREVPEPLYCPAADDHLSLTADYLAEHPGHPIVRDTDGPPDNPPLIYAASSAFDRTDDDAVTLYTFTVLCLLATQASTPKP